MLILAIDTTGFSTSVALVKDGKKVFFNKISSGFIPDKNWWDFPYFLPSCHQRLLIGNLKRIFPKTGIGWKDVDAIAVSANSGIYNCILVGLSAAETLAYCHKKPLIKVDHILAHIYSTWLERNPNGFQFPILVFSASGSHSNFSLLENIKKCEIIYDMVPKQNKGGIKTFIGIGKVFYQIGRRLGVITPVDSGVNKLTKVAFQGNPYKFNFVKYYHRSLLDLNFSNFMKLVDNFIKKEEKKLTKLSAKFIRDISASFQESITKILVDKIIKLAKIKKAKEIHIVGGISENKYLKKKLKEKIRKEKLLFVLRYPVKKEYRLDNAAMIGVLGYYQQKYNIKFINFRPQITH